MPQTKQQRQAQLAKIHLGKKQLGLDDDTYRAMLKQIGGVESAGQLSDSGLNKVLHHLKKSGATFKAKPGKYGRKPNNLDSKPQLQKIEALLADMHLPWDYALGIAKRMYTRDALEFCTGKELLAITTALIAKQTKLQTEAAHAASKSE